MLCVLQSKFVYVALPLPLSKRDGNDFKNKIKLKVMITDHLRKAHLHTF